MFVNGQTDSTDIRKLEQKLKAIERDFKDLTLENIAKNKEDSIQTAKSDSISDENLKEF